MSAVLICRFRRLFCDTMRNLNSKVIRSRDNIGVFSSLIHSNESETKTTTTHSNPELEFKECLDACDKDTETVLSKDMLVYKDFLSKEEEQNILDEIEPYMRRVKYEYAHWDDAIHGFRETEKKHWTSKNKAVIERVKALAFPPSVSALAHVHILDLAEDGLIKAHIDAVRFCGDTIAGLSLLSPCVMRLAHEKTKNIFADVLLPQRSLYIMKGSARYNYTHEVLPKETSSFKGNPVEKLRRISVICRNEPVVME